MGQEIMAFPEHGRDRAGMSYGYTGPFAGGTPWGPAGMTPAPAPVPMPPPGMYGVPNNPMSCSNALNYPLPNCGQARVYPLNFGGTVVAAGAQATFTARPQKTFKAQRIACPSFLAQNFQLESFRIGTNDQVADASGIGVNLQVFSEVSQNTMVEYDTACVGIDVTVTVRNISAQDATFYLTVLGPVVE
jgi:hypothetical protein